MGNSFEDLKFELMLITRMYLHGFGTIFSFVAYEENQCLEFFYSDLKPHLSKFNDYKVDSLLLDIENHLKTRSEQSCDD
jgi:hypothetical protein